MITKFNNNECIVIQKAMQDAINIKHNIEEVFITTGTSPTDMPPAVVPTAVLYDMLSCFEALYTKALELEMLRSGNLKSTRNNIH